MALGFLNIITSIATALLVWPLIALTQNYLRVRSLGLPIVFSPFRRLNPFWVITQPYIAPLLTRLSNIGGPFSIFQNFVDYSTNSCFFLSRYTARTIWPCILHRHPRLNTTRHRGCTNSR